MDFELIKNNEQVHLPFCENVLKEYADSRLSVSKDKDPVETTNFNFL
jgi:hypothetical protein